MTFIRYPHLERFGNSGVQDIEFGVTHVFPKLDGTNASMWLEHDGGEYLAFGSRNRVVTKENDNAGFAAAHDNGIGGCPKHLGFLSNNPNYTSLS